MSGNPQLAKAFIVNTNTGQQIPVMYNPEQYSLDQGNNFAEIGIPGLNAPPIQYVRGKGRVLNMELFFDTYELAQDVRTYSDQITSLLDTVPNTFAPPILLFVMGAFTFRCVLAEATQRFTMFFVDGSPARCTLNVRFHEYVDVTIAIETGVFFGPPVVYNVVQGDTLSGIAAQINGDPSTWRTIATANNILDPFNPPVGLPLVVPGNPTQ
ncbi:MAG TPA: LysM peptidoglycan-binding domain-containing protein [Verrucomicrobiae bacterium]|nr:LysM peptidoglycan-binding domain-containing protein [Verrucomicrobiae bacterium]HTZ56040.1 LysM peptidoglycan-binding domain-containing protein [Candidatus Acidoferrum sp.]